MSIVLLASCSMAMWGQGIETWVTGLMVQYPQARLLDIYKSCFQDYMGAEHLVDDVASARGYLERELESIDLEDLLPWYYEPCGVHGDYVRVSLRVVKEGKITADALLDAFVRSANVPDRPSVESWAGQWHEILAIIDKMDLEMPYYDEDRAFIEQVLSLGKYAISHSPDYREAYSPHYRIIRRDIFERELLPRFEDCSRP